MNVYRYVTPLIGVLLLTVLFVGVVTIHPTIATAAPSPLEGVALKYKGIAVSDWSTNSYASPGFSSSLTNLKKTGANYVCVCITQFVSDSTSNTIFPDSNYTETDASVIQAINDIHARGMGVMLKPMLYAESGSPYPSPSNPTAWFASYATMINHYAQIAQDHGVELLCVGCECECGTLTPGTYDANWITIVGGIRGIYSGPLTYAAGWGTYYHFSLAFWDAFDYAGLDNYFPVSAAQTPTVAECIAGWSSYNMSGTVYNWLNDIETWQASINKPVIFTEFGYRSIDYAAEAPGYWQSSGTYNGQAQANCYEAALQVFANKPWFAGMFWWGWSPDPKAGGAGDTGYTPQNKPAQSVLTADWLQ
jgi:hypothetical protein